MRSMLVSIILGASENVIIFSDSTIIQVLTHLISLVNMLGFIVLGMYLMVLFIKVTRRGIEVGSGD